MSPSLLTLPTELKGQVAESLVPFAGNHLESSFDCRTMAEDIQSIFFELRHLRSFSMTCKDTREFCSYLLYRAVKLTFDRERVRFLEESDDGTLPAPFCDAQRTRLLSLERSASATYDLLGPGQSSEPAFTMPIMTWSEWGLRIDDRSDLERSIGKVFEHYSSITTLDLANFPLSLANLRALEPLKALQTLSIRHPDATYDILPSIHELQFAGSMPRVSNLSIVVAEVEACRSISNVLKVFEKSLVMLSVAGQDYSDTGSQDFIGALLFANGHNIKLEKLEHLSIDFLEFRSQSLRELVVNCNTLKSLAVDCRGTVSFLPLFYIIDLIRFATGRAFDVTSMVQYDLAQEDWTSIPDDVVHYIQDAKVWKRPLSRFFCSFAILESESGPAKTLEHLELVFASGNEDLEPINADIQISELLEVFYEYAPTFKTLKTLTLAISDEVLFESAETDIQLKDAVAVMCRDNLPSVRQVTVEWGQVGKFCWSPRESDVSDRMDIDIV